MFYQYIYFRLRVVTTTLGQTSLGAELLYKLLWVTWPNNVETEVL